MRTIPNYITNHVIVKKSGNDSQVYRGNEGKGETWLLIQSRPFHVSIGDFQKFENRTSGIQFLIGKLYGIIYLDLESGKNKMNWINSFEIERYVRKALSQGKSV